MVLKGVDFSVFVVDLGCFDGIDFLFLFEVDMKGFSSNLLGLCNDNGFMLVK